MDYTVATILNLNDATANFRDMDITFGVQVTYQFPLTISFLVESNRSPLFLASESEARFCRFCLRSSIHFVRLPKTPAHVSFTLSVCDLSRSPESDICKKSTLTPSSI